MFLTLPCSIFFVAIILHQETVEIMFWNLLLIFFQKLAVWDILEFFYVSVHTCGLVSRIEFTKLCNIVLKNQENYLSLGQCEDDLLTFQFLIVPVSLLYVTVSPKLPIQLEAYCVISICMMDDQTDRIAAQCCAVLCCSLSLISATEIECKCVIC